MRVRSIVLVFGSLIILIAAVSTLVFSLSTPMPFPSGNLPAAPATAGYQRLTFTIGGGESRSFSLPEKGVPVRIEVSMRSSDGGVQGPTSLMYAVVNQDPFPVSLQESWIGTNNNGTVVACNSWPPPVCPTVPNAYFSPSNTIIAAIFAGVTTTIIADLKVLDPHSGTLAVEDKRSPGPVKQTFVVSLWW